MSKDSPSSSSTNTFALGTPIDISHVINFLYILRERWLWGLSSGLLAASIFAFVTLRQEPLYETEAYLLIEAQAEQFIDVEQVIDTSLDNQRGDNPELENHLRQMQSRTFFKDAAKTFTPEEEALIVKPYLSDEPGKSPPKVLSILAKSVTIKRDGQVFSITAQHQTPVVTKLIANRFAYQYITRILTRSGVGNQSALEFLERQTDELRTKISLAERGLADYRSQYNLVSLDENQNIIVARLKAINEELTSARMNQLKLEATVGQVSAGNLAELDLTEIPVIARYGSIPDILRRKKEIESVKAELNLRYLEMHPRMIEVQKRLAQVEGQLEKEIERAVKDLNNQKDAINRHLEFLMAELQLAETDALELDQTAVEYNVLKRQLDSDRHTFDQIINRLNETVLSAKLQTTNLKILDDAIVPTVPVEPNPKKILLTSGFLFVLGLCGLPLLLEQIDNRLKSVYDVETFIGKPLLADLPFIKRIATGEISDNIILEDTDELVSESFRSIYSGLQLHSAADMPKVLLITSTRPSEGKSFVSSNLVASMARHGLRCLLVDSDFRRPSLHRHFDLRNDKGIISWYEKSSSWGNGDKTKLDVKGDPELGITTIAEHFDFLRAGGSTKKSTELIDSSEFERLMKALRSEYDVILLDTPPVSVFTDSIFLSEFADEIIYVARFNEVPRQKVRQLIHKLDTLHHHKVVGVIINGRTSRKGQRYGYDYSYSSHSSDYKYYKRHYREEPDRDAPGRTVRSRRSIKLDSESDA